ncbi:MAG: UspA domain protein [Deltaproteobacteria bacterium]|nr:UspA domain protein [Deltaproteobacteria bacterium]
MTSHPRHVVVGYDFSQSGHAALHRAVTLAAQARAHVLHVICVIDSHMPIPSIPAYDGVDIMYAARVQEALAFETQQELEAADVHGRVHFFVHARIGSEIAGEILALAREVGAELIIVGSHGLRGLDRWLLGSSSEKIVREAQCSVEIARTTRYPEAALTTGEQGSPDSDQPSLPAHRYEYEDHRVNLRPPEWPLY